MEGYPQKSHPKSIQNPMVYYGLSWFSYDLSRFIMVYHYLSCVIMDYYGLSWLIMIDPVLSWFIMVYHGLL